jgi:hypothetical protein
VANALATRNALIVNAAAVSSFLSVARIADHLRHDCDAGLEPGHAEGQLGKDEEREGNHHQRVGVFSGQRGTPVGNHDWVGCHLPEGDADDDDIQQQIRPHEHHRHADGLTESPQEHGTEQRKKAQRDHQLVSVYDFANIRVLDHVCCRVSCREGHRDDEVSGRKAEKHQDEDLSLPEGEKAFQHRDRTFAMWTLHGHAAIHRQRPQESQSHEHQGGDRRKHAGRQRRDARLVAEGREVVDPRQAHHLPPSMALMGTLDVDSAFAVVAWVAGSTQGRAHA